jgi:hypothetical protein
MAVSGDVRIGEVGQDDIGEMMQDVFYCER